MIQLPKKFEAYRQQAARRQTEIANSKAFLDFTRAKIEQRKALIDNLQGVISAEATRTRNELYMEINRLKQEEKARQAALDDISGANETVDEAMKMWKL